jgi:hypothetical protein
MAAQRGVYTVSFAATTFAAASGDYDFFEITPADDKPVEIVGIDIGNKTEVGDAQDEMVAWSIVRGHATSGNGTAATPRPLDPSDGAASFTAETVGATIASTGTPITVWQSTFNIRAGLLLFIPEPMRPKASQADTLLVVRLLTALADDADLSGTLFVREL